MLVLPNTPPTPLAWKVETSVIPPEFQAQRASLCNTSIASQSETARYILGLEEYLEGLFQFLSTDTRHKTVPHFAMRASELSLTAQVPWKNVERKENRKMFKLKQQPQEVQWTLANEIQLIAASLATSYIKLGAEHANDLIDAEIESLTDKATDEKWRSVANQYKRALSFSLFGSQFTLGSTSMTLDPRIFVLIDKCCHIGIQMSSLSKNSWLNRNSYNNSETFSSSNNNILCRVAIFVLDEVTSCFNLVDELRSNETTHYKLNYDGWKSYLSVFQRYATAYAGLFLSIEYYQKDKLGQAIGLINFSLLSLQSKSMKDLKPSKHKILNKFRTKITGLRNEQFVQNLNSITTLRIDKSVFSESSGLVLNDLQLLFDQLVQCHLKYTKENDNLKFDAVSDWKDVHGDSRWPLGSKIPISAVEVYCPKVLQEPKPDAIKEGFTGRGSYF